MKPVHVLPAALLATLLVAGTAAARTRSDTTTLPMGEFHETDLRLDADWTIAYNWTVEGNASAYFDIHTHRGNQVEYAVRTDRAIASAGNFTAPTRGTYSVLWENRHEADAVTVRWNVTGEFIDRAEHFPDETSTPGPTAVGVLVACWAALTLRGKP